MIPTLTRRAALLGLAGGVSLGRSALALAPAPSDKRVVIIILRGAMDGMGAVVPYGDPALLGLRADLMSEQSPGSGGLQDLGGFYGLHPSLAVLHGLYKAGEMLPVHAVAGHYRSRSHFEAQDYLESGADQRLSSGWLNRVVGILPARGREHEAVTLGVDTPLIARGPAEIGSWAPSHAPGADDALLAKVVALNDHDPILYPALIEGVAERRFAQATVASSLGGQDRRHPFIVLAEAAGQLLAASDGPRIAALELGGWDTHQNQRRQLASALSELDGGIAALHRALGPAWRDTAILTLTEFGRTARANGTGGTDHGTGTVAFLAGGSVNGGRVLSDWPGLGAGRLLDDRDLQPTRDVRSLAKGLLAVQLGLGRSALERVFPQSREVEAQAGLFRASM